MSFMFNQHGVCQNPQRVFHVEQGLSHIEIEIAKHNGKWVFGYSIQNNLEGRSSPCSLYGLSYANERECTIAASVTVGRLLKKHTLKPYFDEWFQKFRQLELPL